MTVTLSAADGPNLRVFLKNLIRKATAHEDVQPHAHAADLETDHYKGTKLLNYDLQILYDWCKPRRISKVVLVLQDSEAFDGTVLTDILALLQ